MSLAECTLWAVASLAGKRLPELGRRGYCVFRTHKRADKTLSIFKSRNGDVLYKCHSCDPPYNLGDAVQLYAGLYGLDRKTAWHELRDKGYAVPGSDERYSPKPDRAPRRPRPVLAPRVPVAGEKVPRVLHFDQGLFKRWAAKDTGARAEFAAMRGLKPETLATYDVVDVSDGLIGFGYREPDTRIVCRVKMRPIDRKTYWIEPKPPKGVAGKAIGPLYLSHLLTLPQGGIKTYVIVTEGEIDALSLKEVGLERVVSLPDGAASSKTVNVAPISFGHEVWFVATDNDEEGQAAYEALRTRARDLGIKPVRVIWQRGEEMFKDANEALTAGLRREEFISCLDAAAKRYLGFTIRLDV